MIFNHDHATLEEFVRALASTALDTLYMMYIAADRVQHGNFKYNPYKAVQS